MFLLIKLNKESIDKIVTLKSISEKVKSNKRKLSPQELYLVTNFYKRWQLITESKGDQEI